MSRLERPRSEATTVRIRLEAHEQLRDLAGNRGESMQDTLSAAIDRLWREDFWERTNAAYEALRRDPALWQQELEERAEWQAFDPWPDE